MLEYWIRFVADSKDCHLLWRALSSSGAHSASYSVGTCDPFVTSKFIRIVKRPLHLTPGSIKPASLPSLTCTFMTLLWMTLRPHQCRECTALPLVARCSIKCKGNWFFTTWQAWNSSKFWMKESELLKVASHFWLLFLQSKLWSMKARSWATIQKVVGSFPYEVIGFFNMLNPTRRILALETTQPVTHASTRNFPGSKGRPAFKAHKLTATFEPIV
jgi:hypothetical protein